MRESSGKYYGRDRSWKPFSQKNQTLTDNSYYGRDHENNKAEANTVRKPDGFVPLSQANKPTSSANLSRKSLFARKVFKIVGKKTDAQYSSQTSIEDNEIFKRVNKLKEDAYKYHYNNIQPNTSNNHHKIEIDHRQLINRTKYKTKEKKSEYKRISFNSRRSTIDFNCFEKEDKLVRFSVNVRNKIHKSPVCDDDCDTDDEQIRRGTKKCIDDFKKAFDLHKLHSKF